MTDLNPIYQHIIGKCLTDAAFKQQFIADPVATLRAERFNVPEGVKVIVVENPVGEITFRHPGTGDRLDG